MLIKFLPNGYGMILAILLYYGTYKLLILPYVIQWPCHILSKVKFISRLDALGPEVIEVVDSEDEELMATFTQQITTNTRLVAFLEIMFKCLHIKMNGKNKAR